MATTATSTTADAELHAMLASLQRESLAGGGREEVMKMLEEVLEQGIDASENKLEPLKDKMKTQRLVLRGSCPMNMKAVNTTMLESQIREGKLQRPPFTNIFIKSSDGSLDMCVPLGVDIRSGSKPSEASLSVIGRGIVGAVASNPSVTFSMECSQWSGSREACATQATTNCDWYSNGCYTHAFILEQKQESLKEINKLLASLTAPTGESDHSKGAEEYRSAERRKTELENEIKAVEKEVEKDKRAAKGGSA